MTSLPRLALLAATVLGLSGCLATLTAAQRMQEGEWLVYRLADMQIDETSELSMDFSSPGRIAGRAACNRYSGAVEVDGDAMKIGPVAGTKMLCPRPWAMEQEAAMLSLLNAVQRFEFDEDGSLILHADDGRSLAARRR